ncbi:MAG TPA: hypothetical protein VLT85_04680 [Terriglobales bacterium]|nr:hypothetical protein [Terriglobales bacterium]
MRKTMLAMLLSLGVALVLSAPALARDADDYHRGPQDARQSGYQQGYRDGYDHGRADRAHRAGYNYHNDDYQRGENGYNRSMGSRGQFKQGYRDGYQAGYEDGYNNRNARYGNWGQPGYGQPGYQGSDVAYNTGYQDGLNEGTQDLRTGHSYRPTEHAAWQDADHNLSTVHADKQDYKNRYRQGYEAGYQQGYGQPGSGQQGYGGPGGQAYQVAYNTGYQDGLREGAEDRRTGHSYRPHEHAAWKDADHNLSTVHVDSQEYKNRYRQGYERGYQQGYGRY